MLLFTESFCVCIIALVGSEFTAVNYYIWRTDVCIGRGGSRWIVEDSKESVGCENDWRVQFLVS